MFQEDPPPPCDRPTSGHPAAKKPAPHRRHYALIKNLARLTAKSNSRSHVSSVVCRFCLQHFGRQSLLDDHTRLCRDQEPIAVKMPEKGSTMSFSAVNKQFRQPYFVVADFEAKITHKPTVKSRPETPLRPNEPRKYPWVLYPFEQKHVLSCPNWKRRFKME